MDEFQSEMANSCSQPGFHVCRPVLCLGPKHRVSAANICHYRVGAAIWIAHGNAMGFTRVAAIFKCGSFGKETAKYAMFHVENRQLLIGDNFQFLLSSAGR